MLLMHNILFLMFEFGMSFLFVNLEFQKSSLRTYGSYPTVFFNFQPTYCVLLSMKIFTFIAVW
jgi:hypothetical protein